MTIVIPTYQRDSVLLGTIEYDLKLDPPAAAILVVDQTVKHSDPVERRLTELHHARQIRWIRWREPSQPAAMNFGLRCAVKVAALWPHRSVVQSAQCADRADDRVQSQLPFLRPPGRLEPATRERLLFAQGNLPQADAGAAHRARSQPAWLGRAPAASRHRVDGRDIASARAPWSASPPTACRSARSPQRRVRAHRPQPHPCLHRRRQGGHLRQGARRRFQQAGRQPQAARRDQEAPQEPLPQRALQLLPDRETEHRPDLDHRRSGA